MLIQRIFTAIVLIPLVLWLVLKAPLSLYGIILALVMLLSSWEWSRLIPLRTTLSRLGYCALVLLSLILLYKGLHDLVLYQWLSRVCIVLFVACGFAEVTYPQTRRWWARAWLIYPIGLIILSNCWWSLMQLKLATHGAYYIIYLLLLVWVTDTAAYFTGKLCGKHKLIVNVSPGKTWEGFWGGAVGSVMVTLVAGYLLAIPGEHWVGWLLLGIATMLLSVIGDLLISLLKRNVKLKDSGALLPGHGGILDRIDSLLTASIFFTYIILQSGFI